MKSLSRWAKINPIKTRVIIVTIHLLLIAIAFYIGTALYDWQVLLSRPWLYAFVTVFIIVALLYPYNRTGIVLNRQLYIWRKTSEGIAGVCSFCMLCWIANNYRQLIPAAPSLAATTIVSPSTGQPTAQEILASLSHRDKSSLTKKEKRILKKEFKRQLKTYVKASINGNKASAEKALLIMLAIIAAVGLLYLVAAMACQLSCSGAEGAAVVVAVLGTIGVIWLLVVVIKKISRGKKEQPVERPPAPVN